MSGTIGWTSVAAADTYFATERLESTYWEALLTTSTKDMKTAVLTQAYNRLRRSKDFTIPATPTADQLEALEEAQCETAYYLATHGEDEDLRKGIQAQGVVQAGIEKESYAEASLCKLPLPPIVYEIMEAAGMFNDAKPFYAVEIGRDENKDIDEDVTDD